MKWDNNESIDDDDEELDKMDWLQLSACYRKKTHSLDNSPRSPNTYWLSNALEVASSITEMDRKLRMRDASPHNRFAQPISSILRKKNASRSSRRQRMDMYLPDDEDEIKV